MVRDLRAKIAHMRALGSVHPLRVVGRALPLPLERRFGGGRALAPLAVTLEITNRCNLDCAFCFLQPDVLNSGGAELEPREALAFVRQVASLGAGLYITGGEPMIRSDLPDIVAEASRLGVRCGINTNGVLLGTPRGARLLEAEPTYLLVSPHSLDAGTPTGRAERQGLGWAAKHRGRTRILLNAVLGDAPAEPVVALARELALDGVTFQHPTYFTPEQRATHAAAWTAATGEADPGLAGPDGRPARPIAPPASNGLPVWIKPDLDEAELGAWYDDVGRIEADCHYPWTDLRVQPDGEVVFCQFIERRLGNVRQRPLGEIWRSAPYRRLRRALVEAGGSYPGCSRCCKLYRASSRRVGAGDLRATA